MANKYNSHQLIHHPLGAENKLVLASQGNEITFVHKIKWGRSPLQLWALR